MPPDAPTPPHPPASLPVPDAPPRRPAEVAPPRWRTTLYDLFVETFAVVLGITVAVLANNWQTARTEAARAGQARASLVEELRANRALVVESRAYHRALLDSMRAHQRPGAAPLSPRAFSRGFVHPASLYSTAWEAATSTGALELLPYADVLTLSRVYAAQQSYRESSRTTGQIIYQALYDVGVAGVTGTPERLRPLITSSMYLEEQLVAELDTALSAIAPPR